MNLEWWGAGFLRGRGSGLLRASCAQVPPPPIMTSWIRARIPTHFARKMNLKFRLIGNGSCTVKLWA